MGFEGAPDSHHYDFNISVESQRLSKLTKSNFDQIVPENTKYLI